MLNNKGASFVDLLVSLVLLMAILSMMFQFQNYMKRHREGQYVAMIVLQISNNEAERAYRTPGWSTLSGETFESPRGEAQSRFLEYRITEFHTERLLLEVEMEGSLRRTSIERSVYWDE